MRRMLAGFLRFDFGVIEVMVGALLALSLVLTVVGLRVARRRRRAAGEARLAEANGGWRYRARLEAEPGDPYGRFESLRWATLRNVRKGQRDGFEVSHFDVAQRRNRWRPCAVVQLPVEGPRATALLEYRPEEQEAETEAVLRMLQGMDVEVTPFAILVRSTGAPANAVHRAALSLAKAIVEDARAPKPRPASGGAEDA